MERSWIKLRHTDQVQFVKTFNATVKGLSVARKKLAIEIGNTHEGTEMSIHGLVGRKNTAIRRLADLEASIDVIVLVVSFEK